MRMTRSLVKIRVNELGRWGYGICLLEGVESDNLKFTWIKPRHGLCFTFV